SSFLSLLSAVFFSLSLHDALPIFVYLESLDWSIRGPIASCALRRVLSREGLLERLFEKLFHGLVYTQIWKDPEIDLEALDLRPEDRKSTRLNSSHEWISYAVFCLK